MRNRHTPTGALTAARADLARSVEVAQQRLADAITEQDEAERDLADLNAKLKAMDEFIAKTVELAP